MEPILEGAVAITEQQQPVIDVSAADQEVEITIVVHVTERDRVSKISRSRSAPGHIAIGHRREIAVAIIEQQFVPSAVVSDERVEVAVAVHVAERD